MSKRGVSEIVERVSRPTPSKIWSVENRWGQMIGDTSELRVTRFSGGSLRASYNQKEIDIPQELVDLFAEMVAYAADWKDEHDA